MSMFQRATKRAVRARIGVDGPSGSGKTYTALEWATVLGKKIAVIDTERGSASLYSDLFDFDVLEISPPFHPDRFVDAIKDAEKAGYEVLVIDSLSHAWDGEGGVLDIVDAAAARQKGNSYTAWKSGTPVLRHLVDTILASDLHVIVTMRSKTEYVLEENERGQKQPRKVGMAPVMRAGMEYELTLVGDMDLEHRMTISKSRCPALSDLVVQPGRARGAAETFVNWTQSGAGVASRNEIDALKSAFGEIEPKEVRAAAKRTFADQFGNPDYLLADRLEEAMAFVAGYTGEKVPSQPAAAPAPVLPAAAPAPAQQPRPSLPGGDEIISKKEASRLHAVAHRTPGPDDRPGDHALDNDTFRVLVFAASNGTSDSAAALTAGQGANLEGTILAVRRGNYPSNYAEVAERWLAWTEKQNAEAVA